MVQAPRRRAQPSGRRGDRTREAPIRKSKTSDAVRRGKKKSAGALLWEALRQGFVEARRGRR
jgi:hypothetical protein